MVALTVFAGYCRPGSTLFKYSIIDAVIVFSIAIPVMVLFKTHPQHFGPYKTAFKPDPLSQCHYWILASMRILLSILLIALNPSPYVGFFCLSIPILSLTFLSIRRPYLHLYNNIRALLN